MSLSLADSEHSLFSSDGVLAWYEPEVCCELTTVLEIVD